MCLCKKLKDKLYRIIEIRKSSINDANAKSNVHNADNFNQKVNKTEQLRENLSQINQRESYNEEFYDARSHFSFKVSSNKNNYLNSQEKLINSIVSRYSIKNKILKSISNQLTFKRERRTMINPRPNINLGIKFMKDIFKKALDKDLFRIPLPCNFNEPLSGLQKLNEDLEYSILLDKAAECEDPLEQMKYVAAFAISSYSNYSNRPYKPFNPLLGETFENDRTDDKGWRSFAEQITHHPPGSTMFVESINNWELSMFISVSSKFQGQSIEMIPNGFFRLKFLKSGNYYTWEKVKTYVNNIILGQIWLNHTGLTDIVNHKTKDICHLKFFPYSKFSSNQPNKLTGIVKDSNGIAKYVIDGICTEKIECANVINPQEVKSVEDYNNLKKGETSLLWERTHPPEYLKNMYNMTLFSVQLNEPEPNVAPTDSRLRPDQRLMEEADWDKANEVKLKLEEKQRAKRAENEQNNIKIEPVWFEKQIDECTNEIIYTFNHKYWNCKNSQDWKMCPDIFL